MKKNQLPRLIILSFLAFLFSFSIAQAEQRYVSINNNAASTEVRQVTVYLLAPSGTRQMTISNKSNFEDAKWEPYATAKTWTLESGAGLKTVYVRFKDASNQTSQAYSATITLNPPQNMGVEFQINNGDEETSSRYVNLKIKYSVGVESMIISNENNFGDLYFQAVNTSVPWTLTKGSGQKKVYIQFKDSAGKTKTIYRTIKYTQPENYIEEGNLLKSADSSVYYLGEDGKLHPFLNSIIYYTWYEDFNNIKYLSLNRLRQYEIGQPVCLKPGTWLVKSKVSPTVYAVEPGCQLRPILSAGEATILYGANWGAKVLEFSDADLAYYKIRGYSVANKTEKIIDRDRDGVSAEEEKLNATSDTKQDSDEDGLSDYEEIYYWFSDPTRKDSDEDGIVDGVELINGFPPNGGQKLSKIPTDTYEYPYGTVFSTSKGNYYYRNTNGKYYSIGSKTNTRLIKSNKFSKDFLVKPILSMTFKAEGKSVTSKETNIYYPTVLVGDVLSKL